MDKILPVKNIVIFAGGAGSGKSEVVINYSLTVSRAMNVPVHLIDLDIVKAYFRSRELKELLESKGVEVVSTAPSIAYSDLPALSPRIDALLSNPVEPVVVDVGGDEAGARVLGRYREYLKEGSYEFLQVININRPFMQTAEEILNEISLIEEMSRLKTTGLVNNTNLMGETDISMLIKGKEIVQEVSRKLGKPVKFQCLREDLIKEAREKLEGPIMPLVLHFKPEWIESV